MPTVDFVRYTQMLDRALAEQFAYPAINVLETATLNAAIEGSPPRGATASSRSRGRRERIVRFSVKSAAGGDYTGGARAPYC